MYHTWDENPMIKQFWGKFPIVKATAWFFYTHDSPYAHTIHLFKYHGRKKLAFELGKMMASEIMASGFFNGIDWFMKQDGQALHQSIMSRGYKLQDINDLPMPFSYPAYEQSCRMPEPSRRQRAWRKFTYNGILLPSKKKEDNEMPVVAPAFTARPVNFYRVEKALNYDYCSRKGFVTQKSLKETIRLLYKMKKISIKSRYMYKRTVKEYEVRGQELMTLDFWKNYLDI